MKKKDRIIAFPRMGKEYRTIIEDSLRDIGFNILPDIPVTDKTIKLGVKHAPDMFCFPYKVTLGNSIECLEAGANTLFMYDTKGTCRFTLYNRLQDFTLKNLGYNFEMIKVDLLNIIPTISKLGETSLFNSAKTVLGAIKKIHSVGTEKEVFDNVKPNIVLLGEIYCVCDEVINYNIESKLKKYDCNPINTVNLGNVLTSDFDYILNFDKFKRKDKYAKQALQLIPRRFGGHARENIETLLRYLDKNVDGIIHIEPLSCMPESAIEPYVNHYCSEKKKPLLRIYIDENNSEANLETRVETFVELVKWKKNI